MKLALRRFPPILFSIIVLTTVLAPRAWSVEEAELFLSGLRARGYYDTANEYLELMRSSNLVDEQFKTSIPYEQALTLVSQASAVVDARSRDQQLAAAIVKFKEFVKAQPKHPQVDSVQMQIGNVLMALGKSKLLEAEKPGAEPAPFREAARKFFTEARAAIVAAEGSIQTKRKALPRPVPPDRKDLIEVRDKLRGQWVQSELLQANVAYELSRTYESGSDDHTKQLTAAAKEYEELFGKHRVRLAGLYSRVQQMRCLVDKKDYDGVLTCFPDLTEQDGSKVPQIRRLQLESLSYALDAWIGQKKYDDAIAMGGLSLSPAEEKDVLGMTIQLKEATANLLKAQALKDPGQRSKRNSHLSKAKNLLKPLAKKRWEKQAEAREQLVKLGSPEVEKDPTTFDEAFDRAVAIMQKIPLLKKAAAKAPPAKKAEIQKQLDGSNAAAFDMFNVSLSFVENDTSDAKLSATIKALCFLYYERQQFQRSAVLGDYLARYYPQSTSAKFGTYMAMNGWVNEFNTSKDRKHEMAEVRRTARHLVAKWPNSSEAIEARYRLVILAVQKDSRDVNEALLQLQGIPEDSPRRASAELTVGQTLWNERAKALRLPEGEKPPQAELDEMLAAAKKVLGDGIARMQGKGKVNGTLVGAAYALAQLYAGINQPDKALELIEHEEYGPLSLVQANDPIAVKGDYGIKTYRLALRSYIGALPSNPDKREVLLANAMKMVEALEKAVGDKADSAERLTAIYIEMGKELEEQIKYLIEEGDDAGKAALSQAFEAFLVRIGQRGDSYSSLIWIAETFFGLGNSNDSPKTAEAAKTYFGKAAATYEKILRLAKQDKTFIKNPRQRATIYLRLALCKRKMGDFKESLDMLVAMLEKKRSNLTVQVAAAEVLFDWGSSDCKDYEKLYDSILGGVKDEKDENMVWGWRRIARLTSQDERFSAHYFDANLHAIKCRYVLAICLKVKEPKRHKKLLFAAEQTLIGLSQQFPDLGGAESKAEYDRILKKIQLERGKSAVGLVGLKKPETPEE